MRITVSQIFQIGAAIITAAIAICSFFLDGQAVGIIGGAIGTLWGTIGTILTTPAQQAAAVAANVDNPVVKQIIVPAVSNLPGLEPLKTNARADATLKNLAASDAPANAKIT